MSSLKSLYQSNREGITISKYLKASAPATLGDGIESEEHLASLREKKQYFLPPVDYSDPENFVKFGSAEQYYNNAFEYIASYYPYDGSSLEKTQFYNDINPLEKYTLEVVYPRSTGFVTIGSPYGTAPTQTQFSNSSGYYSSSLNQYIQVKGGPHKNTKFNAKQNRVSNLQFGGLSGSSVEFFLKKNQLIDSGSESPNQVIFDLNNAQSDATAADYGRLRVELVSGSETQFRVTLLSGTNGFENVMVPSAAGQTTISDGTWRNFAFVFDTSANVGRLDFYVNGKCIETGIASNGAGGKIVNEVTGTLIGNIGALRADTKATTGLTEGAGKLSASIDEFRFWKAKRTAEQVGRHWFTHVEGGSDKYDANVSLGVYYKFNEGLTLTSSIDKIVLDYSGRVSNGLYTGYNAAYSRNTGSSIDSLGLESVRERGTPIIRKRNPLYMATKNAYQLTGSNYDYTNSARLINHLPSWVTEQEEAGSNEVASLTQIMSSYFDTLYNQLTALRQLKYNKYISGSLTDSIDEFTFNDRLVDNTGIRTPELFENIGVLGQFFQRDEAINFDQQLVDIKNSIYKNIYNNISYILKSKGNEKSIRNFIRCLGVGEEILSLNTYPDNTDYNVSSSYLSSVSKKKYADFTSLLYQGDSDATVYQYYDSSNSNSVGLISGSISGSDDQGQFAFSLQSSIVFPNKDNTLALPYDLPPIISSSLVGFHVPEDTAVNSTELTWTGSAADYGLQLYAVRKPGEYAEIVSPTNKVKDAYFVVEDRAGTPLLVSDTYSNVYDNQNWNFSLSLKPKKYPFSSGVPGASASNSTYELQLYGTNYDTGVRKNSFTISTDLTNQAGMNILKSTKRIYAGAHRTNFTGSVVNSSDVRASSIRYWTDYIPPFVVDLQARDVDSYGLYHPTRNAYLFQTGSLSVAIPSAQTLALNWDFETVTGSNTSGRFIVADASSGSSDADYPATYQGSYLSNINLRQHTGRGDFFRVSSTPVRKQYLSTEKLIPIEYTAQSDMIRVPTTDDRAFASFRKPSSTYFAVEKSMYRGISNRMLHLFASIDEFNNLIGEPVNKYRLNYKAMEKLREIFFRKVQNDIPSLQKYLDYYKWLDTAMGQMIEQLFPVSARYAPSVRNIVESHSLERNKYQYKFPIIRDSHAFPEGGIIGEIGGGNTPIGVEGDPHNPSTQGPERPIDANPSNQPGQGEGRQGPGISQQELPPDVNQDPQPPEDNNYGEEDDRDGQMAPAPPPAEQIDPNQGQLEGGGNNPGLGQGQGGGNFNPPGGGYG
tara:strand:- start:2007 stop:5831 length:3825 start_codon:yes stop_codon:yes gene_type:complete